MAFWERLGPMLLAIPPSLKSARLFNVRKQTACCMTTVSAWSKRNGCCAKYLGESHVLRYLLVKKSEAHKRNLVLETSFLSDILQLVEKERELSWSHLIGIQTWSCQKTNNRIYCKNCWEVLSLEKMIHHLYVLWLEIISDHPDVWVKRLKVQPEVNNSMGGGRKAVGIADSYVMTHGLGVEWMWRGRELNETLCCWTWIQLGQGHLNCGFEFLDGKIKSWVVVSSIKRC